MEDGKHRSRRDDADRKEIYKRSDRERNGDKHSERERNRDRDKEKESEEKPDRNRVREKSKEREIEKKDRNYRRSEEERNSQQYADSRYRDSREKENDNSKKRHRDDRERGKDKEKDEREKLKERIRDRDRKRRDYERVRADSDSDDERDKKRRRREGSVRGKEWNKDKYKDDDRERERNKDNRYRDDDVVRRKKGDRYRNEYEDIKGRKKIDTKKSKNDDSDEETKDKEDMEEEQRRFDEEMEKRRRRVQEWQELRRKKKESESEKRGEEKNGVEPKSGKKWTLEGEESDDELDGPSKSSMLENVDVAMDGIKNVHDGEAMDTDNVEANVEDEVDPLDAFMNTLVVPDAENVSSKTDDSIGIGKEAKDLNFGTNKKKPNKGSLGRIMPGDDSDADNDEVGDDDENQIDDEGDDEFIKRVKKTKVEKLSVVDHSKIQYPPFRKDFYREVREVSLMTAEEVAAHRKELELKIRGKDVPRPVKTWNQTGLTLNVLEVLKKLGYGKPMPIQAQSLPIIMSGRDFGTY